METHAGYLWSHPPKCVAGFKLKPINRPEDDEDASFTSYELGCACGSMLGSVMGHALQSVNPEYSGPEIFVSPLDFACKKCAKIIPVIDSGKHGYSMELGMESSVLRGEGRKTAFRCPKCSADSFGLVVIFGYSGAELDAEEDEPTGHVEDLFLGFSARGTCAACGTISVITDLHHL